MDNQEREGRNAKKRLARLAHTIICKMDHFQRIANVHGINTPSTQGLSQELMNFYTENSCL